MLPKNGDILSGGDRIFSWARLLSPLIVGIFGALLGGYTSYQVAQAENRSHFQRQDVAIEKLEARVSIIESGQTAILAKLASLEAKADLLLAGFKR